MASGLTRLPDELLMIIFDLLDLPSQLGSGNGWSKGDVRPSLCALAVTCSRLSDVAREFMLKDVRLATGYVSSFDPPYTTSRLRLFVRTCYEHPSTAHSVKSLDLQCDFSATPDWGAGEDDRIPNNVLLALSKTFSLKSVRILLPGSRNIQWLPSLFPEQHKGKLFPNLETLYLDCGHRPIPGNVFLALCMLPGLKHIETPSSVSHNGFEEKALRPFISSSTQWINKHDSAIESLRITNACLHFDAINGLLAKTKNLKDLHITVPGLGVHVDDEDVKTRITLPNILKEFSPISTLSLLTPVKNTLRSLSMTNPHIVILYHDNSCLDLSYFKHLEHLKLSIHFLCGASLRDAKESAQPDFVPRAPSSTFYQQLPPKLKTLEIHYDSNQGIFYDPHHLYRIIHLEDPPELNYAFTRDIPKKKVLPMMFNELWEERIGSVDGENGVRNKLAWLLNLADVRDEVLPCLTQVTVRETSTRDYLWRDFSLTDAHPSLFENKSLKMDVVLRVPKKWKCPNHTN